MADTLISKVVEGCSNLDREDRCNLYMTLGNLAAEGISARGGLLPLLNERVMEMMVVDATSSEQEQSQDLSLWALKCLVQVDPQNDYKHPEIVLTKVLEICSNFLTPD